MLRSQHATTISLSASSKCSQALSINRLLDEMRKSSDRYSISEIHHMIDKLYSSMYRIGEHQNRLYKIRKRNIKKREEKKEKENERKRQERISRIISMDLPIDWNNAFNSDVRAMGVKVDSIPDALTMSLVTLGKVDIEYISSITGADYKTIICSLRGSIYQNPERWGEVFYKGWETADEYLSGNMIRKLKVAQEANNEYKGYFADNISAIKKALPSAVSSEDIYITLGTPWVPADVIDDFIEHLFGRRHYYRERWIDNLKTKHDEHTGIWKIPSKYRYDHSIMVCETYGTHKIEALHILERTLNMKSIIITKDIKCLPSSAGTKKVIDKEETLLAIEKQKKMISEFQEWVWSDPLRKERLEKIYEERYGCIVKRSFDGSFLAFPGMSPEVELYSYQKDAVARIIFTPNTLLAHDVGAGKTYIMVAAGQELRRMGQSSKNMYVVPNSIVGQWKSIFLKMYPDANLLIVDPKSFVPLKRNCVLKQIRDNDYDGIIIAYSCFDQIRIHDPDKADDEDIKFDDLGITRLFVDEAHNYKNVPIDTGIKALGINTKGSDKCRGMLEKVYLVQKNNGGKGIVMATGTPVTNSITDVYAFQRYLQSGELATVGLQSFDSWIGMFAERKTEFEIDVDTSTYRVVTRFSSFHNLPELTSLISSIADFHVMDSYDDIPSFDGYSDELVPRTDELSRYLEQLSERVETVRNGHINRTDDNMLKITTDGRKAALDIRLVDPSISPTDQSKVVCCARNVADIFYKTSHSRSTQIIFCDTSTPKAGFNVYDELKNRLIGFGIPSDEIAFVHDADTQHSRSQLFRKVNCGDVRVLIGSTFKLGTGVNVQKRLIAIHHIDVPWRPSDMIQREGRILRQGNTNPKVFIYRYITEGSFDAYSWQLLETKQRFITELFSGTLTDRNSSDIDDTVLDYAEVKALAIGNPLMKSRIATANELGRFITLQQRTIASRERLEKELYSIPGRINRQNDTINKCTEDISCSINWNKENESALADEKGEAEKRRHIRFEISRAINDNVMKKEETRLLSYRGFDIVLPSGMSRDKPFIWLQKNGRYHVDLGESEVGYLIRIDNCLNTLEDHRSRQISFLKELQKREQEIITEISNSVDYTDQIEEAKLRLSELDHILGVNV